MRRYLLLVGALVAGGLMFLPKPAMAEVVQITTRTGLTAWLVQDNTLPLVTMRFAFAGGAALDPVNREGLSSLLAATLDEGAGGLDSSAFQAALAERSIRMSFSADEDAIYGYLKFLKPEANNAFALLRLALHEPRFDEAAVARMKASLLAARQANLSDPNWLASQGFETVGLAGHPYGRPAGGAGSSLFMLTREDLQALVPQRLVRDRMRIAVVGDITPRELAQKLDEVFSDLPVANAPVALPPLEVQGAGELVLIERNQPQTMLLAGAPGYMRRDPDWWAGQIVSYVLGGDFQSRLMTELRIKAGLTYGASTALVPYDAGGVFYAMTSTENAKAAELLTRLRGEMARLAREGVADTELSDAKNYLTGSFALRFGSSDSITDVLLEVQRYGFPPSYLQTRGAEIEAVTKADTARVAEALLKPENLTVIAVGRPEGLQPTQTLEVKP